MTKALSHLRGARAYEDSRYGTVYELAGESTGLSALGLAVAVVRPGATSPAHFHRRMSEIYLITAGTGLMQLGEERFAVSPGMCISIAPGVVHAVTAVGETPLAFVVVTSPSYDFDDDHEIEA
jgi:mannose-6-phosphate isomerase-like protein (cupin superfamily)